MSITSDLLRGHTETIILKLLIEKDSYGYEINKSIQEKTNNLFELKEATLYSAFRRLETAGLIASYWGDEATGARRRYYTITYEGRQVYQQNKVDWEYVCKYQKLSENFINEFRCQAHWEHISIYQKLSENFIKEFRYQVDWYYIRRFQRLSENFINELELGNNVIEIKDYAFYYQTSLTTVNLPAATSVFKFQYG